MKHLIDNNNRCLIFSAAMVLNVLPDDIINFIGHDGTQPNEKGRMTGVHIQEIQDFAFSIGHLFASIEMAPYIGYSLETVEPVWPRAISFKKFMDKLNGCKAILIYDKHAVAWDGEKIYNPARKQFRLHDYKIKEMWVDLIL